MSGPDVDALVERLYAALKHEKSCTCGRCSGGLNAVDDLAALARSAADMEEALAWGETFLARHDAFLQQQTPQIAYAMRDAADGFRDALAAARSREQQEGTP